MKKQVKKILFCGLGLSIFSTQSAPMCVSKEQCTGSDDQQSCYRVAAGMYQTSYPWLNEFIWKTTFPETELKMSAQNLDTLVQQMLEENLLELNDPDSFPGYGYGENIQTWNKPEESGDYLQISSLFHESPIGGRGVGGISFSVFKKSDRSLVENIFLPGTEKELGLLLQNAVIKYLMDSRSITRAEAQEIVQEPIEPSDSWHFAKDAIVFNYSVYQIDGLAFADTPSLAISVSDLTGLVREDILQAAHQWPIPYQSYDNNSDYDDCISVNDESL